MAHSSKPRKIRELISELKRAGYCPDLYFGGVCHGDNEEVVYTQLCEIVRDEVAHRIQSGDPLPVPAVKVMRELEQAA